ncbi:MAG: sugar ABC transporter permease [Clostridiales bacterium]|nr:MAG: sugar ABC transporter permease [Clostridiales bacterium]
MSDLKISKTFCPTRRFQKAMLNSCKYTFWSLLIGLPIPIILAIMLNELVHCKGIFFRFSVYFPAIIPGMVTAIMWKILLEPGTDGFLNVILSYLHLPASQWLQDARITIPIITVVTTWSGFGPTTILYLADLQSVDLALYEAAAIDGAGFFKKTAPHNTSAFKLACKGYGNYADTRRVPKL